MNNFDDDSSLAAVLDFYSDRAEAHASFFLASLFGLFTVLSIAQNADKIVIFNIHAPSKPVWAIPYWLLFLVGLYTFANFCLYATYAQKIKEKIKDERIEEALESMKNPYLLKFQNFKERISEQSRGALIIVIGGIYFIIALVSYCLVLL